MRLEEFVDEQAIGSLKRPTALAEGLPGAAYGKDFHDLEQRALFPKAWVTIAVGAQLPKPGDMLPVEFAGQPLLLVRGNDGTIRCFHNICRHRAMRLVDTPCKAGARITCPWHAWSYDLEGRLAATPNLGGMNVNDDEAFDRSALGLKAVRCAQWLDFVFVNLDGKAPAIEDYLAALLQRIRNYDLSGLVHDTSLSEVYEGNWKFVIEGGMEDYHLPWGHPELQKGVARRDVTIESDGWAYSSMTGTQTYEAGAPLSPGYARALPELPNLPPEADGVTFIANIFPNAILTLEGDHVLMLVVLPEAWNRSRFFFHCYFPTGAATDPAHDEGRRSIRETWKLVLEQDKGFVERVQANTAHRDSAGIATRFSPYWESAVQQFQRMVTNTIDSESFPKQTHGA